MSRCDSCVADKKLCDSCRDNPKFKDYPHQSHYQVYIPTCPRGYSDCVSDPAYIKYYHPEWYKELYGNLTPYQAAEECRQRVARDLNEDFCCYDCEDK